MSKSLNERLDALANRTGIPQVTTGKARRRPMRWLPVLAITAGTTGIVMALSGNPFGQSIVTFALLPSIWLPMLGPVKPWGRSKTTDERDEWVRDAAYIATLPWILLAAVALLIVIPWRVTVDLGAPDHALAAISLGMCGAIYLLTLWNSIPTLYASLKWPSDDEDGED